MKTRFPLFVITLISMFALTSCDSAEPVSEEESQFSMLACQDLVSDQNYNAWCGADGSGLKATVIGDSDMNCSFVVNYQDSDLPAYSASVQVMGSPQIARIFVDNLSTSLYQKIEDVSGVGDQAVYFQADSEDTTRALVARSSNVVATVIAGEDSDSQAACTSELDELKSFTNQLLRNL